MLSTFLMCLNDREQYMPLASEWYGSNVHFANIWSRVFRICLWGLKLSKAFDTSQATIFDNKKIPAMYELIACIAKELQARKGGWKNMQVS